MASWVDAVATAVHPSCWQHAAASQSMCNRPLTHTVFSRTSDTAKLLSSCNLRQDACRSYARPLPPSVGAGAADYRGTVHTAQHDACNGGGAGQPCRCCADTCRDSRAWAPALQRTRPAFARRGDANASEKLDQRASGWSLPPPRGNRSPPCADFNLCPVCTLQMAHAPASADPFNGVQVRPA